MIRYALKCDREHGFESWFQSGAAFADLLARGLVTCPECGSRDVDKAIMAPSIAKPSRAPAPKPKQDAPPVTWTDSVPAPLSARQSEAEQALHALRAHVEATADYIGDKFADEARAMYLGDIPERPIYGEARPEEARALIEDGVPVMPLPFGPRSKVN